MSSPSDIVSVTEYVRAHEKSSLKKLIVGTCIGRAV